MRQSLCALITRIFNLTAALEYFAYIASPWTTSLVGLSNNIIYLSMSAKATCTLKCAGPRPAGRNIGEQAPLTKACTVWIFWMCQHTRPVAPWIVSFFVHTHCKQNLGSNMSVRNTPNTKLRASKTQIHLPKFGQAVYNAASPSSGITSIKLLTYQCQTTSRKIARIWPCHPQAYPELPVSPRPQKFWT